MPPKRKAPQKDYYLVKYLSDGILSIKEEDDLEHEMPTQRTEFWVDDLVLCFWDDMEKYTAKILAIGSKVMIQMKLKELTSKSVSKKAVTDIVQQCKKKQAMDLLKEMDYSRVLSDQSDLSNEFSIEGAKSLESHENTKEKLCKQSTETSKHVSDTNDLHFEVSSQSDEESSGDDKKNRKVIKDDEKWQRKYLKLKRSLTKIDDDDDEQSTPKPGLMSLSKAKRFKMKEIVEGTGVYWSAGNEQHVERKSSNETQLTAACIDTFLIKVYSCIAMRKVEAKHILP